MICYSDYTSIIIKYLTHVRSHYFMILMKIMKGWKLIVCKIWKGGRKIVTCLYISRKNQWFDMRDRSMGAFKLSLHTDNLLHTFFLTTTRRIWDAEGDIISWKMDTCLIWILYVDKCCGNTYSRLFQIVYIWFVIL